MIGKKLKKQELLLLSLWLIILTVIIGDAGLRRFTGKVRQVDESIVLNSAKLSRLQEIVKHGKEIDLRYDNFFSQYKKITDSDNLLQIIESVARRNNISIVNIKPAAAKEDAQYRTFSVKVELQEDVAVVGGFLNSLLNEVKSIGVERVSINAQNRDELPKTVVLLRTVVFKE